MTTITVTREQVERVLGSGNAKHSPKTLARQIGDVIVRKFYIPEFGALDLSKIGVNKSWDGRIIELTFVPDPESRYKDVEAAAQRILDFFINPDSRKENIAI